VTRATRVLHRQRAACAGNARDAQRNPCATGGRDTANTVADVGFIRRSGTSTASVTQLKGLIMNRKYLLIALLATAPAFANDVDPFGFEKEHFTSSASRAQVEADLKQAQRAGQLPVAGEIGVKVADAPSHKTRQQVVAETLEARRLGLLVNRGELGPVTPTAEQERQIALAGLRAIGATAEK
jgi:hypothetical protein